MLKILCWTSLFPNMSFKFYGPFLLFFNILVLLRTDWSCAEVHNYTMSSIFPCWSLSFFYYTPVFDHLPQSIDLDKEQVKPEAIVERRLVKKGNSTVPQVLIKWTPSGWAHHMGRLPYVLYARFPVVAWGQATLGGRGDVMLDAKKDNVDTKK